MSTSTHHQMPGKFLPDCKAQRQKYWDGVSQQEFSLVPSPSKRFITKQRKKKCQKCCDYSSAQIACDVFVFKRQELLNFEQQHHRRQFIADRQMTSSILSCSVEFTFLFPPKL
jgi:hypothetical protein